MGTARIVTSNADRLAALRVAHAATSPEQPFEFYAGIRLRVPRRREADWWLLEDEAGEPVASLMSYPLDLAADGERLPGYGIGAVATRPDRRREGHASDLCARAALHAEESGRPVGLLFSAIPPALYERLEFRVAPAHAWRASVPSDGPAGEPALLTPIDGMREADALAGLYGTAHAGLHLHRDAARFRRSCERGYEDVFFALGNPMRGYVRLHLDDADELEITEWIVPADEEPAVLAAVFELARGLERPSVVGWMPPSATIEAGFEKGDRSRTLPMVRGHADVDDALFWSSDYF